MGRVAGGDSWEVARRGSSEILIGRGEKTIHLNMAAG